MKKFSFGPAFGDERIVFGAQRPGYKSEHVGTNSIKEWVSFMKEEGIKRVCCLLPKKQLDYYLEDLLNIYYREFGEDNVRLAAIKDYHLCGATLLKEKILPFLEKSDISVEPVVVHCSGGSGRTGLVLTAWLIFKHGLSVDKALTAVENMGRNPREAVQCGNATVVELRRLLMQCQRDNVT